MFLLVFCLGLSGLCAQHQDAVDFLHAEVLVQPFPKTKQLQGEVTYTFKVLSAVDSVVLDAKALDFTSVRLNGESVSFTNTRAHIVVYRAFAPGSTHTLGLKYSTTPKQTVYFLGWTEADATNNQVWTQGQGKYTSHWLPSVDDINEKVVFNLQIKADTAYTVVANGKLAGIHTEGNTITWQYAMQKPMSSYLVAFALGTFDTQVIHSASGVPIHLYYAPKDSARVEPTYRYTQRIFDFLEEEIGVPYPWQNYKQVPVRDFLYAGMENTGTTFFAQTFMVDSTAFVDKNYVNVNAHELAHQWFGNLVTAQRKADHWLHEGFATYYAYLAERAIFGDDAMYWRLWESAQTLAQRSQEGQGEALTQPDAGSLTFYEKGAWALALLRKTVGEAQFVRGIQQYLTQYAYQNATIPDFIRVMEQASGISLTDFEMLWLQSAEFPWAQAQAFLQEHSPPLARYMTLTEKIDKAPKRAEAVLRQAWPQLRSQRLKHQLLLEYGSRLSPAFLTTLLQTEGLSVRQAVAMAVESIPPTLQTHFETLLEDASYHTQEVALYRLWMAFPDKQHVYLDKMAGRVGFPNHNLRLLWLTLALATPDYRPHAKPLYFDILNQYTQPSYPFEVRWRAFQHLQSMNSLTDTALQHLIEACTHHVWRFSAWCRHFLQEWVQDATHVAQLKALYPSLEVEAQQYVNQILNP